MSIIKIFEFTPYVIGYHVYKDRRTPVKSEMLKEIVESKNREDKFAVAIMKDDCLAGYLAKVRTGKFTKNHQSRRWNRNEGAFQVIFFNCR